MIAIVDYEAGNLTSVGRALRYLGLQCVITPDPAQIRAAERVIFPGVGHAASAMETLRKRGLDKALHDVFNAGTPLMGICLGTQIILSHSEEGDTPCLGLLEGSVHQFKLTDPTLKIPHMGWNAITPKRPHPVLKGVGAADEFYFVHSFYPRPADSYMVVARCEYEIGFAAVIGSKNLIATQFHPEKSGELGLELLRNFAQWDGVADAE
jgi:glutamine amidotransferase